MGRPTHHVPSASCIIFFYSLFLITISYCFAFFCLKLQQSCVTEPDHRVSEIQGFLELSVQRSSCEMDHYKDRLFVYLKGHEMPLSTAETGTIFYHFKPCDVFVSVVYSLCLIILFLCCLLKLAGIRSFDFLGLGYRIDWPISIVLTPDALKIYADIFSFLIQLKLAVFSVNDVWCSLKVRFLINVLFQCR